MMIPPTPSYENERLNELKSLQLIGLDEQDEFDMITSMAATICGTKISLISLITEDKQWFLSRQGLEVKETPREISLCAHAILTPEEPFLIENAREDERFYDNPLVVDAPNLVFYAGFPLITKNGYPIGTLCAIDDNPKSLSKVQIKKLKNLSSLCVKLFEYRKNLLEREELLHQIDTKNHLLEETQRVNKIGVWEYDLTSGKIVWSDIVYQIHELPYETAITVENGIQFYHRDYVEEIEKAVANCIQHDIPYQLECILITTKGNQRWVKATGRKVGEKLIGSFQDITELKNNELKFKAIFNSTFTFIGFLNLDGILLEANDTAITMAGITHEDVIGKYFWDCYWWQISENTKEELKANFFEAVKGKVIEYEVVVWVKDKTPITILFTLKPIFDENGEVVFVIPEGRPIQEIVDNNRRYKSVLDGTNAGTWEWNIESGAVVFNERWAAIAGYTLEELAPISIDTWHKLVHPQDLINSKKRLSDCFQHKIDFYEFEARVQHKNGDWIWVLDRGKVFEWTNEGAPLLMYGTRQDITIKKQNELALKVSEEAFRGNFESAGIGMALVGLNGNWLKVNRELCNILGYSEDELLKRTFQDITHPDDLQKDLIYLNELIEGKRDHYQMEKRYFHKEGHIVYIILAVSMVKDTEGTILHFISQIIDISKRKKQEFEIAYQQDLLNTFYKLSPIGIALMDYETGNFIDVNEKLLEPSGYTKIQFLLLNNQDITPPEYQVVDAKAKTELDSKGSYQLYEKELIRKDGTRYPVALQGVCVNDVHGNKRIWSIIRDISTEKEAERKLKEALSNFQAVLDASTQVSIIATDTLGQITFFNSGAEKLLGYSAEEMINLQTPLIIHKEEEVKKESKRLSLNYKKQINGFEVFVHEVNLGMPITKEWTYIDKDKNEIPVLLSVNAITTDHEIVGYLGIATDITIIKKVDEIQSLLNITEEQNNRLKNFAQIVSHNLRSHSGGISGIIELLRLELPHLDNYEQFDLLKQGAKSLVQTVDDLADIVKVNLTKHQLCPVNLYTLIEKNRNSLLLQLKQSDFQLINEVDENFEVQGVPVYVDSIVLNFITNAIKYRDYEKKAYLKIKTETTPQFKIISFEDNGVGIDLNRFGDKLFGMYKKFHNREDSRGIGLFITKNQIESMGGKIEVESEVNQGTTFKIFLKP
ncbi:PAS domain S-box protein [Flavobacterium stagni]|uniref:histidine kinase n=2 Tax=Flavobacterium stagni TaxID=2506421 RepID=A0A4Q1K8X7_9FLAO|nr:PAS domain S-box protein [Flavobacterium stagni]